MRSRLRRFICHVFALGLTAFPSAVLAQQGGDFLQLKAEKPYLVWAIGVAFLAVTLVVVFKHPRRGHQG